MQTEGITFPVRSQLHHI